MGWGRVLPIVGIALLLLIVPIAMCVGLGSEPTPRASEAIAPPFDEPLDELDEEPFPEEDEPLPEPEPAEGLREITGVVSGLDDEPLEGIDVHDEGSRRHDVTDRDGRYRLRRVGTAPTTLEVRAPGYAEAHLSIARGEPGEQRVVDVFLEAGDTVGGKVVDADGRPVARATVRCADRRDGALAAQTDGFGRFELPAPAAGCEGVAEHQGSDSPRVTLASGPDNVIELVAPASIAGVVVDAEGKPVRTFVLAIESFRPAGGGTGTRTYRQTFSHPQGRFTMSNVPAGTYVLSASTPRIGPVRTADIAVEAGAQVDGLRIVLR
jgi:hypothetical protein